MGVLVAGLTVVVVVLAILVVGLLRSHADILRRLSRWGLAGVTVRARYAGSEQRVVTDRDGYVWATVDPNRCGTGPACSSDQTCVDGVCVAKKIQTLVVHDTANGIGILWAAAMSIVPP